MQITEYIYLSIVVLHQLEEYPEGTSHRLTPQPPVTSKYGHLPFLVSGESIIFLTLNSEV